MKKPVCTYKTVEGMALQVGRPAILSGVKEHPFCHGKGLVRTSYVVSVALNGAFETENTKYIREI